jgi:Carboxypeptidase regulatory-like domain
MYAPMMIAANANPDSPVSGAMIIATNSTGYGFNATSPSGNYIIMKGLTAGTYNVSTFAEGYINQDIGGISVIVGSTTSNVNFSLKRSGGISGKVTDSASGLGLSNIVVSAFSHSSYGWFGVTDSTGNFRILTNLQTGVYNVTIASAVGYNTNTVGSVSVSVGVETTGVNIALSKSAIISGFAKTPAGNPIPGVTVTALSSDSGGYVGVAVTGVDGSYKIQSNLGSGTYMVTAYSGTSFDQVQNVVASVGQEKTNVNLTLSVTIQPTGAISGLITDANNKPIVGATVEAGSGHASSNSNGVYLISSGLPTGSYTVSVSAVGYQNQDKTGVAVTAGSTTSGIDFKLVQAAATLSGRISGIVTGEEHPLTSKQSSAITCVPEKTSVNVGDTLVVTGSVTPSASGATVRLEYKSGSNDVSKSVTTGSDGKYTDSYTATLAGSWTVEASWSGNTQYNGASSESKAFSVSQPSVTTGGIKITVLDSANSPIVGATVSSTVAPTGQTSLNGVSGSDGSVSFTNVAVGSYTFSASKTGYTSNTATLNVVAGSIASASTTLQTPAPNSGGIKVTVSDNNGAPIVGATVSSTSTPSGQIALSGVSGSDGSTSFTGVAPGSYTLQAIGSNYVTNSGTATVVTGSVANITIKLQTQSTGGSGVPGYPYEAIISGVVLVAVVLILLRRRQ